MFRKKSLGSRSSMSGLVSVTLPLKKNELKTNYFGEDVVVSANRKMASAAERKTKK